MKKGFTLVELLAVIFILSIILVISVPNLISNIKSNKQDASKSIENIIIAAARNYVIDYELSYPTTIPLSSLCNGYIECPILDVSGNEITGSVTIDQNNHYSLVQN